MNATRSIDFFEHQFSQPLTPAALQLNPFEQLALPHLHGELLDHGCGLGNLSFAAAAQGCRVTALDASPAAIEHVSRRAAAEGAEVSALLADLGAHTLDRDYDAIAAIGLLMFFDGPTAQRVLAQLQSRVRPGGVMALNVLIEGTTYTDMFDPQQHCLFTLQQLRLVFAGWTILVDETHEFPAPHGTVKRFSTVVARRPAS